MDDKHTQLLYAMTMYNRVQQAQHAYRNRDKQAMLNAHLPQNIATSLEEQHSSTSLSDVILGGQDGLVNVLGVILGVAAASGDVRIIQAAGLAAAFAESVSMGAVAYTSTVADTEHYQSELKREKWEIEHNPTGEAEEIRQIYIKRGFSGELLDQVVEKIVSDKKVWLDVMMVDELRLQPAAKNQALKSTFVVGLSAIVGSLIPLFPFFFLPLQMSVTISLAVTALTLFLVGVYKAKVTVGNCYKSGIELTVIGMVSALVGYWIGSFFKAPVVP